VGVAWVGAMPPAERGGEGPERQGGADAHREDRGSRAPLF